MSVPPDPWSKVSNGWQRRLYGGEVAFAAFGNHPAGHGHSTLLVETTITSAKTPVDIADNLRDAWKKIRFHTHPLIAVELAKPEDQLDTDGYSIHYPDSSVESVERWAQATVVGHRSTGMSDLVRDVDARVYKSGCWGAELHFASTSNDTGGCTVHLLFVSGHWITDGRGALKILSRLVEFLNSSTSTDLDWGTEVPRLSVPLGVATGKRQAVSGEVVPLPPTTIDDFMQKFMSAHAEAQPTYEKPLQPMTAKLASPQIRGDIVLSEADSAKLLYLCRQHGTTVTALLNVVLAMAYVDDPSQLRASKTLQIPFFSVHRGQDLVESHQASLGLCMTIAPFVFGTAAIDGCLVQGPNQITAMWAAAQAAKPQLVAAKSSDTALMFDHEAISAILPSLLAAGGRPFFSPDVLFATSVGSITPYFAQAESKDQWTVRHVANGFVTRWYRTVVHYWEWQGKTTLRVVASSQYHTQDDVNDLVDKLVVSISAVLAT